MDDNGEPTVANLMRQLEEMRLRNEASEAARAEEERLRMEAEAVADEDRRATNRLTIHASNVEGPGFRYCLTRSRCTKF